MKLHGNISQRHEWSPQGMKTVPLSGDVEEIINIIRESLQGNFFNLNITLWDEDRLAILRGEVPNSEQLALWESEGGR